MRDSWDSVAVLALETPLLKSSGTRLKRGGTRPGNPRTIRGVAVRILVCAVAAGCRREQDAESAKRESDPPQKPSSVLVFPEPLHVDDGSVNAFVTEAMNTSAAGNYEAFRLLWSAREQPLAREEFEQGWHAVQEIRIEALEKVMLDADASAGRPAPETVYALLAQVSLDPTQRVGQKEPQRKAVLVLTLENDRWRLAKAPRELRDWIKSRGSTAAPNAPAP